MIAMVVNTAVVGISVESTFITCSTWWLCCWCIGALCRSIWITSGCCCWTLCRWNISIVPVVLCSSHQWVFSLSTEFTLEIINISSPPHDTTETIGLCHIQPSHRLHKHMELFLLQAKLQSIHF